MSYLLRRIALLLCLFMLGACAASKNAAVPAVRVKAADSAGDQQPGRMLVWKAQLTIQVGDVAKAANEASAGVEQRGGYVEQKSENRDCTAELTLRVPSKTLKSMMNDLESLGKVTYRNITGEDVTEQYIDVDAKLRNLIALRDRLKQHLEKAADVKDILAVEVELNRVQTEIDSLQGQIKSLKGKSDYATIQLRLERKPIPGPLGYIFGGIGWCVEKLFFLRN